MTGTILEVDAFEMLSEMDDNEADCAIVDFPWEFSIKNGTGRFEYRGSGERAPNSGYRTEGHADEMFEQIEDAAFLEVADELSRILSPGSWIICFADDRFQDTVRDALRLVDELTFRRNWAWHPKSMGMGYYGRVDHYPVPTATVGDTDRYVQGRGTLYTISRGRQTDYPTGKPARLCRDLLAPPVLKEGDTLLEPFCGHAPGSQAAAARGIDYVACDVDGDAVDQARIETTQATARGGVED